MDTDGLSNAELMQQLSNDMTSPGSTGTDGMTALLVDASSDTTTTYDEDDKDSAIQSAHNMDSPIDPELTGEFSDNRPCTSEDEERFESYGENDDTDSQQAAIGTPQEDANSNGRRITSNALASQLFKSGLSAASSCNGSDDMFAEDIAEDVYDLNSKVHNLQDQVAVLAETQVNNNEKQIKMKQDNAALTERVHMLEEQLRDSEYRAEKRLQEEQKRYQEMVTRLENDKAMEVEAAQYRLKDAEDQCRNLREDAPRLRLQIDKLKQDKQSLEEELAARKCGQSDIEEDRHNLQEKCQSLQRDLEMASRNNAQMVNELNSELSDLRKYKSETESMMRLRTPSLLEYPSRFRDMDQQMRELKEENSSLREQLEETQVQMLNIGVQEGSRLLNMSPQGASLAEELATLSKDEVMEKLQHEQQANKHLRKYIDNMLLNVMDQNPAMLEIRRK